MLYHIFLGLRTSLFYLGYSLLTLLYAPLCMLTCPLLPLKRRLQMISFWCRLALIWLRICCGIRYQIKGSEHIPAKPCVIVSKHQSPLETFLFQILFLPITTVLKIELTRIPLFGWALRYLEPITIDRRQKKAALSQIIEQGQNKLKQNFWVLIFPEGTRIPPGTSSRFSKGGFVLAQESGVPVLPVALNAGDYWKTKKFLKYPGTTTLEFGPEIPTNQPLADVMQQTLDWLNPRQQALSPTEKQAKAHITAKL